MRARWLGLALLVALLVTGGCYARPRETFVYEEFPLESVRVLPGTRPRVEVRAELGDTCSELQGIAQDRRGNEVILSLVRRRRTSGECRPVIKRFDETIELRGDFPPGAYILVANGDVYPFRIPE